MPGIELFRTTMSDEADTSGVTIPSFNYMYCVLSIHGALLKSKTWNYPRLATVTLITHQRQNSS
jgi:hypothetical protein